MEGVIIYQAQPNKCFPPLCQALVNQLGVPYCEFGIHLESLDRQWAHRVHNEGRDQEGFWLSPQEFREQALPYRIRTPRWFNGQALGFVYGLFDEWRIDREPGDFVFTIISDPVNRVYDLYYFWERFLQKQSCNGNQGAEILCSISSGFSFPQSMRAFVDLYLAAEGVAQIGSYRISANMLRQQRSFEMFDYVGIVERIDATLEFLSRRLGVVLAPSPAYTSRVISDRDYRRGELEVLLADDLAVYQQFLATHP